MHGKFRARSISIDRSLSIERSATQFQLIGRFLSKVNLKISQSDTTESDQNRIQGLSFLDALPSLELAYDHRGVNLPRR